MDEQTNEMQAQPQASLNLAVQNALGKMQKQGYSVKTRFKDYSHLKCTAKMRFNQLEVFATSAYAQTSQEVLDGLVLHVLLRLFRFKQARFAPQLLAYKKFVASAQAQEISRQLIQSKGRKKKVNAIGDAHDLHRVCAKVLFEHGSVLKETLVPQLTWSDNKSRRLLARHDEHSNRIIVSKLFDSTHVPQFVVEYLLYHELLHAKWGVKFNEENFSRKVHPKEFKADEKKFNKYKQAIDWIGKNSRYLR